MARVVTTDGTNLKGGGEKDPPLDPDRAEKLAAQKNKEAEALGLQVRYVVEED